MDMLAVTDVFMHSCIS